MQSSVIRAAGAFHAKMAELSLRIAEAIDRGDNFDDLLKQVQQVSSAYLLICKATSPDALVFAQDILTEISATSTGVP